MKSYLYTVEASPSSLFAQRLGAAEVAPGLVEGILQANDLSEAKRKILNRLPSGHYPIVVTIEKEI